MDWRRAGQVGGLLEPGGDREQCTGLLGEQAGQRPVERDERERGVQQRAGGVLERGGAVGEQPLDGPLARERRPRRPGTLGGQLLVERDDAPWCRVVRRSSEPGPWLHPMQFPINQAVADAPDVDHQPVVAVAAQLPS